MLAVRTLRSGMMSGVTSPARPWFRLTTQDPDMAEQQDIKVWLEHVTQRMQDVFLKSNLYNALPIVYGDMGVFGTAAMLVEEDMEDVFRCYVFPIGSYWLGNDEKLQVRVFYREFRMTVRQLVEKFGVPPAPGAKQRVDGFGARVYPEKDLNEPDWSNFSTHVRNLWERGLLETWIDVVHLVQPNRYYDPSKLEAKHKKYESVYFERGFSSIQDSDYMTGFEHLYLRTSGYDYFPVLCPRWETTGEDVYGTECPGMVALGDIKQLYLGERKAAQAIEKMVNPPLIGPSRLASLKVSLLPGDITYDDSPKDMALRPIHEVLNLRLAELDGRQQMMRQRISRAFYEDLFLMMAQSDRREITAKEIEERHEEKLLALGPVLEQLNQDLLDPLIDIVFMLMMKQGRVPMPPKSLHGQELKIEYVSVMAQAQKLIGIESMERFMQFAGQVRTVTEDPSVLDSIDIDKAVEKYGEMTSVPPEMIRPADQVAQIRQNRAAQQQAAAKAEQAQQMAKAAQSLGQAQLGGNNALQALLDQAHAGNAAPTQ